MNNTTPMIIWCVIASVAALLLVLRPIMSLMHGRLRRVHLHHFIEFGDAHDEFYVPGDEVLHKLQEYDPDL